MPTNPTPALQDHTHRLEDLLRQILYFVQKESETAEAGDPHAGYERDAGKSPLAQDGGLVPEELLEVEIDGSTYALTRRPPASLTDRYALSPREREIVRLVAKGLPNKAIAGVLEISAWTVATHLRRIFAKLEVNSRAEMVARALNDDLMGVLVDGTPAPAVHTLTSKVILRSKP